MLSVAYAAVTALCAGIDKAVLHDKLDLPGRIAITHTHMKLTKQEGEAYKVAYEKLTLETSQRNNIELDLLVWQEKRPRLAA